MAESRPPLYHYEPSIPAAVVFTVLFAITTLVHLVQMLRRRSWFLLPLFIGGAFEVIGFGTRYISAQDPTKLGVFIINTLLLLIAPVLFAASAYMFLGRFMTATGTDAVSPIRRRLLTKVFVIGDVVSFFVQASGASSLAKANPDDVKKGENIIIVGLFVQLVFFGSFMLILAVYHRRTQRYRPIALRVANSSINNQPRKPSYEKHLWALWVVSTLIMIRSIFRVIEYIWKNGPLIDHEIYLYVFDTALMFLVMAILNILHPGAIITKVHPERDIEM